MEQKKDLSLLTAIYLDANEIDAALRSLKRMPRAPYGNFYFGGDLRLTVANAAADSHPREALGIYLELAEQAIGQRNRNSYRVACDYLKRIRDLYAGFGEEYVWQPYRAKLQEEYKALRALKDEMAKAKL